MCIVEGTYGKRPQEGNKIVAVLYISTVPCNVPVMFTVAFSTNGGFLLPLVATTTNTVIVAIMMKIL